VYQVGYYDLRLRVHDDCGNVSVSCLHTVIYWLIRFKEDKINQLIHDKVTFIDFFLAGNPLLLGINITSTFLVLRISLDYYVLFYF
jgi:hypothetical protein